MKKQLAGIIEYGDKIDKGVATEILERLESGESIDTLYVIEKEEWSQNCDVVTYDEAVDPNNWDLSDNGHKRLPIPKQDFTAAESWIEKKFEEYCNS